AGRARITHKSPRDTGCSGHLRPRDPFGPLTAQRLEDITQLQTNRDDHHLFAHSKRPESEALTRARLGLVSILLCLGSVFDGRSSMDASNLRRKDSSRWWSTMSSPSSTWPYPLRK